MGIGVVLSAIPWTEVINAAPTVIENAKKLWSAVAKKPVQAEPPAEAGSQTGVQAIALLEERIAELETRTGNVSTQMRESTAIIKTLAEQNSQLIARIEANRKQIFLAVVASTVTAVVAVASLVLVLVRTS